MTTRTRQALRMLSAATLCAVCSMGVAAVAHAQASPDARWDAFLGCWSLTVPGMPGIDKSAPVVCVTPTPTSSAVQVATIRNDSIVARDTIDANGVHRTLNKQGCAGWEDAEWSADSRRVYLHSDVTCAGGLKRMGNGVFAIGATGQWVDVQSMLAGGNEGVRVNHYRELPAANMPKAIANPVAGRELTVSAQRTAAAASLNVADIAETVQHTDTAVTQAWLVERGAQYSLDAKKLVLLADAGVPGSVTDVMVGVSYPEHFALQAGQGQLMAGGQLSARDSARIASAYANDRCFDGLDPLWDVPGSFDPCYGTHWGLRNYGYGYGFGYGSGYYPYGLYDSGYYSPYGYYGFGGGYYPVPVVVVKGDQGAQTPHGRVVNGRGYTQGSNGSATPTTSYVPTNSGSSNSGSSSSGSSSSGSSSSGSSGSSSGGGRTAVPRPPR
ncbi:MAG TPA: hypothetical protein VGM67_16690 [Gemmatimonadaceae bacterium]